MITSEAIENGKRATLNIYEALHLSYNHEDLDTRMTLHALDATDVGYKGNVGK